MGVKGLFSDVQIFFYAATDSSDRIKVAFVFFLGLFGAFCDLGLVLAVAKAVGDYATNSEKDAVGTYQLMLMFGLLVLRVLISIVEYYAKRILKLKVSNRLSGVLVDFAVSPSHANVNRYSDGGMLLSEVNTLGGYLESWVDLVLATTIFCLAAAYIYWFEGFIFLIILSLAGVSLVGPIYLINRMILNLASKRTILNATRLRDVMTVFRFRSDMEGLCISDYLQEITLRPQYQYNQVLVDTRFWQLVAGQFTNIVVIMIFLGFWVISSLQVFELSSAISLLVLLQRIAPRFSDVSTSIQRIAASQPVVSKFLFSRRFHDKSNNISEIESVEFGRVDQFFFDFDDKMRMLIPPLDLKAFFRLKGGALILLTGPSGVGKSSFLRGLFNGACIKTTHEYPLPKLKDISNSCWIPQHPTILSGDLATNLFLDLGVDEERLVEVSSILGIDHLIDRAELDAVESPISGGEAIRVGVGRALVRGRNTILLDEPLAGLDETSVAGMLMCLKRLIDAGVKLIVVSHDLRLSSLAVNVSEVVVENSQ